MTDFTVYIPEKKKELTDVVAKLVQAAYTIGFEDGIVNYAHNKNGEQQVGTTGRTLFEAKVLLRESWNYSPGKLTSLIEEKLFKK